MSSFKKCLVNSNSLAHFSIGVLVFLLLSFRSSSCVCVCVCVCVCARTHLCAKSLQWCPTLCDPIDSSPPGSLVPGIFQARVLEWGVIAFSMPCLTQWNYKPCRLGLLKTNGSWWRALTKRGPLEKEMINHFSILALKTPWTVGKGKKIGNWKINSPGQKVPNMLLEISGETTPERIKRRNQSKNNTQLRMWLTMKVKS